MTKRPYGEGSIDQRGKDRWRLRYRIGEERFTKSFHGSKSEARMELRRLLKSGDDGVHVAPDKITLAQWIDKWLALIERKQEGDTQPTRRRGLVNARTLERYRELLRLHVSPTLGQRKLQSILPTDLDSLYVALEKNLAPRTVRQVHITLGTCLGAAVRKGLMVASPTMRAEAPSPGDGEAGQVLEEAQLTDLLSGFRRSTLFPLVSVAAFTGARRNEILALQWSDFDANKKTLTIRRSVEETKAHGRRTKEPKTKRGRRTITLDDGLVDLLRAHRERHLRIAAGVPDDAPVDLSLARLPESALIFPSPAGENFDFTRHRAPKGLTKEFKKRATKLAFPKLRFHDLRATHATLLLDRGVPVHVVAARLGHDPAVLLTWYAKRKQGADERAAAVIGTLSKAVLGS
jgi:integrase